MLIAGLADSSDNLWAASKGNLYKKSEDQWSTFTMPQEIIDELISPNSLANGPGSSVLIKSFTNIFEFRPDEQQLRYFSPPNNRTIFDIYQQPSGRLLVSTSNPDQDVVHLDSFENDTFNTVLTLPRHDESSVIDDMTQSTDDSIWFVYDNIIYTHSNQQLTKTEINSAVGENIIKTIHIDSAESIWIFCEEAIIYDDGSKITTFPIEFNNSFFNIHESADGQLFIGSEKGVFRIKDQAIILNQEHEGLFDAEIRIIQPMQHGRVIVGGELGLKIHHPLVDRDPPETKIPPGLNTKEYTSDSSVRFTFRAQDRWEYTSADRLLYSYKVNDGEWSDFQPEENIQFRDLPTGVHTLYARAMDRNMNIDLTPALWEFRIKPPWFLEPLFLLLFCTGSGLILFFGFYAIRNHMRLVESLNHTQRTVSLLVRTKDRLTEAKVKAEKEKQKAIAATKAKDGFLARMSHEIRTPLNGILGNLELAERKNHDPEVSEFIHTAVISSNTLMGIIGNVLDFAKIEADKLELNMIPASLHALFHETIAVMKTKADEKQLSMSWKIDPNTPDDIITDTILLRQVMTNLLSNAIKYTEQGSVTVSLHSEHVDDDNATIRFSVKDTGTGFDESHKSVLFREYERDETNNKTAEGTGLGLAICKRIVELMDGSIDCESTPRLGSCFWFTIPVERTSIHNNITSNGDHLEQPVQFDLKHPVLIVDDMATNLQLGKSQLKVIGVDCEVTSSGKEALQLLQNNEYSLALIDCSMPEIDGFSLTRMIRNELGIDGNTLPIIAMTAHVVSGIRDRCIDAGMNDYIAKPVTISSLIEMIQKWQHTQSTNTDPDISMHENKSNTDPITMDELHTFTGLSSESDMHSYLSLALAELDKAFHQLTQAVEARNRGDIATYSHALKGISLSIQSTSLISIFTEMNEDAVDAPWDRIEALVNQSEKEINRIRQFIHKHGGVVS